MISRRVLLGTLAAAGASPWLRRPSSKDLGASAVLASCSRSDDDTVIPITTVRLARNPWLGSTFVTAIAARLVTELKTKVEVVDVDEYLQFDRLASGELHACLEMWPSRHAHETKLYVDTGLVDIVGALGVIGRRGWYVPSYMLDTHPTLTKWGGLKDPAVVASLATADTGTKGRFLGIHPSFAQYDAQIIANLDLDLELVFAGSPEAQVSIIDAAIAAHQPILFYHWEPSPAPYRWDIHRISLPDYTDGCWSSASSGGSGIDCDYPLETLLKIASHELVTRAPSIAAALRRLQIDTATEEDVYRQVTKLGKTADDVAAAWLDEHETTWRPWLS